MSILSRLTSVFILFILYGFFSVSTAYGAEPRPTNLSYYGANNAALSWGWTPQEACSNISVPTHFVSNGKPLPPGTVSTVVGTCNQDSNGSLFATVTFNYKPPLVCTPPQVNNSITGACQDPCEVNKKLSGTYYVPSRSDLTVANITTTDTKKTTCTDGCQTRLDPAGQDWYTTAPNSAGAVFIEGNLKQTGATCTAGVATPASETSITPQTEKDCQAKGMGYVTAGGVTTCMANGTAGANNPVNLGDKTTTNAGGTTTTETNTTVNNDNSVTTTTTTTHPDGSTSTETKTEDKPSFCEQNASAQICKESDEPDGNTPGNPKGYDRAENRFYETEYPNGAQGVWDDFKDEIDQTSAMNAMDALTPDLGDGGSAPSWNLSFNFGPNMNFGSYTLEPDSGIWLFIRICIIVTALWAARAIIFGG